jgi:hypothetical protein
MTSAITSALCATHGTTLCTTLCTASDSAAPHNHPSAKPLSAINTIAPKSIGTLSTLVNKREVNKQARKGVNKLISKLAAKLAATALAFLAASMPTQAQTLPPLPTSPAPVVTYEYDALGQPTRLIQARTAVAPAVNNLQTSAPRPLEASKQRATHPTTSAGAGCPPAQTRAQSTSAQATRSAPHPTTRTQVT